ncbi:Surfactin synthase thioesterase subunit [Streptomyces zhaozhouensis]|uniref:Surfactin synthase thioesterase subunit n=1 Tax=Streptomyces zhaozhouensis TaxID=1300267 RepID=A0A286DWL5_9ACTN|nr:alpha/beta fold hydrolase [Streptomyces zhaozhouensis]SOD63023.1 Surfactin synthase thioesterase subunit [Streptomyces zhaozhouensis]
MATTSAWVQRFHPQPEAPVRLVCLPHAGGSASYFHPVSAALRPAAEVLAIQYPGRQNRRAEPPLRTVDALAEGVAEALAPHTDRPLALFGHSLGASVAYETARLLTKAGTPPVTLVVSGRRAPSRHREENVHRRDDAGVLAEIRRLGGTEIQLLDDPEIQAMVLPAIRADYEAVETYRHADGPLLDCPLLTLVGDDDPLATLDEARDWKLTTTGDFRLTTFTGGHFYLNDQAPAVIAALRDHLATVTP